jgi:hypothetical protein
MASLPHIGHSPAFGQAPLSTSPSDTPSSLATRIAKAGVAVRLMFNTRSTVTLWWPKASDTRVQLP